MKLKVDYFSKWLLVVIALTVANVVIAQRTITGTITDESTGEPLIGANVLVVGTSSGAVSDVDGSYSLTLPEGATTLEISYTGYTPKRVPIGSGNVINVTLSAGEVLEEVVVTGYGTQKAKEVTSAITSVKEEEFNRGNVTNPAQLLQGKVAGLSIARPGSDPNGSFQIRLRGLSTIGANSQPLVVIDGVIGADLNTVDPNDIASIDVLKDGSAAAIYGTRGASGVILITTKKGASGRTQVDYNGFGTAEFITRDVPVLTSDEYRAFGGGTDLGSNTDWFDEITQTGISQTHNLAISGGASKFSYRAALNFRGNEGIAMNTGFQQLNGRLNLTQKALNDRLRFDVNLTATNRTEDRGFNEAFRYATIYNPTAPVRGNGPDFNRYDGYFQQVLFDYYNPVAILEQNVNEAERKLLLLNGRAEYEILKGLSISAQYSTERTNEIEGRYFDKQSFWVGADRNGLAETRNDESESQYFLSTLNWQENLGSNLTMTLLGGYEFQEYTFQGSGMAGGNFLTDQFGYNNMGAALDFANGLGSVFTYKNNYRNVAFFGRIDLNFNDTYFVRASLRQEGNSRFGAENKWGLFPAASAGVTLSNLFDIAGVDNLKLRVGYGRTGNIPGSSYLSLRRFGPQGNFLVNGEWVPSYAPVSNPNPDLKWETKEDISVGLDFAVADYRLTGSLDFYSTRTNDLILPFEVPVPPNLFRTTEVNVGELLNTGLEAVFNYQAVQKPSFSWNTSLNATYYLQNEIASLSTETFDFGGFRDVANVGAPGQNETPLVRVQEGAPIGQLWGLNYLGVDDAGQWIFEDLNNDGKIDNTDRSVIGNGLPKFQMGWSNNFTFGGNLDFSFFIDGFFGHDLANLFRAFYESPVAITSYNILQSTDDPDLRRLTSAPTFSSLHVENGSFIRLNNATLGYNFKLPEGSGFSRIRLYVTGERLFYITSYKGVDPEVRFADRGEDSDGQLGALVPGIDRRNTWFRSAAVSFGIQLGF